MNKEKKFKILYIEAWADTMENEVQWSWNNWQKIDEIEVNEINIDNEQDVFEYLMNNYFKIDTDKSKYEIYDDQYNLVIQLKNSQKPIIALEYGAVVY